MCIRDRVYGNRILKNSKRCTHENISLKNCSDDFWKVFRKCSFWVFPKDDTEAFPLSRLLNFQRLMEYYSGNAEIYENSSRGGVFTVNFIANSSGQFQTN